MKRTDPIEAVNTTKKSKETEEIFVIATQNDNNLITSQYITGQDIDDREESDIQQLNSQLDNNDDLKTTIELEKKNSILLSRNDSLSDNLSMNDTINNKINGRLSNITTGIGNNMYIHHDNSINFHHHMVQSREPNTSIYTHGQVIVDSSSRISNKKNIHTADMDRNDQSSFDQPGDNFDNLMDIKSSSTNKINSEYSVGTVDTLNFPKNDGDINIGIINTTNPNGIVIRSIDNGMDNLHMNLIKATGSYNNSSLQTDYIKVKQSDIKFSQEGMIDEDNIGHIFTSNTNTPIQKKSSKKKTRISKKDTNAKFRKKRSKSVSYSTKSIASLPSPLMEVKSDDEFDQDDEEIIIRNDLDMKNDSRNENDVGKFLSKSEKYFKSLKYSCSISGCQYRTPSKYSLDSHMKCHTGDKSYKCDIEGCKYSSVRKHDLTSHQQLRHHEHSLGHSEIRHAQTYFCNFDGCKYTANRKGDLTIHERGHTGERPYPCSNPDCTYTAVRLCDLKNHERSWHNERATPAKERPKIHKCNFGDCTYSSPSKREFRHHLGDHCGNQTFRCPIDDCLFRTERRDTLPEHIKRKHIPIPNKSTNGFICKCRFVSKSFNEYKNHYLMRHLPNLYRCTKKGCEFACSKMKTLEIHLSTHQDISYDCHYQNCKFSTKNEQMFTFHQFKHEFDKTPFDNLTTENTLTFEYVDTQIFKCSQEGCTYKTDKKDEFSRHFFTHNNQRVKQFHCYYSDKCHFTTDNKYYIRKHIENHKNTITKCTYSNCTKEFSNYYDDRIHQLTHSKPPYQCPFIGCDQTLETDQLMYQHISELHYPTKAGNKSERKRTSKQYICPLQTCNQSFIDDELFRIHLLHHRSMTDMYHCPVKSCTTLLNYYGIGAHLRQFHSEKEKCNCVMYNCDYSIEGTTEILRHIESHSNLTLYKCFLGNCPFSSNNGFDAFIKHLCDHVDKGEVDCPIDCGFHTDSKYNMSFHLFAHKYGYPFNRLYPCPFNECNFSSCTYSALKSHLMIHTNDRPYKCEYCSYSARKSSHLRNHLQSKHDKIYSPEHPDNKLMEIKFGSNDSFGNSIDGFSDIGDSNMNLLDGEDDHHNDDERDNHNISITSDDNDNYHTKTENTKGKGIKTEHTDDINNPNIQAI